MKKTMVISFIAAAMLLILLKCYNKVVTEVANKI